MFSNANNFFKNNHDSGKNKKPVSKEVEIKGTFSSDISGSSLHAKNRTEEEAEKLYLANLRLTDPTKYLTELRKIEHVKRMKEMASGYEAAKIERDKRRTGGNR
jgi:hypothetical protein